MVERGLVPTRARAKGLILRGRVRVAGETARKAGQTIADGAPIELAGAEAPRVSFGGDKLAAALEAFGPEFDPAGRTALDVGASTGGFTEVLLEHGAARVYAVDVGRGQLHESLRGNPRVVLLEETDARSLGRSQVPETIDALVADVSFISLTKALPASLALTGPGAWAILLIKPQFEAGPAAVGKGGIVQRAEDRERSIEQVRTWIEAQSGWRIYGIIPAPGLEVRSNVEYLLGAHRDA